MSGLDLVSAALLLAGAFFFFAGTVGLLRFPDVSTRLHALTKADNLGLGLVVAGLSLQAGTVGRAVELWAIWMLVLVSSAVVAQRIAWTAWHRGHVPRPPE